MSRRIRARLARVAQRAVRVLRLRQAVERLRPDAAGSRLTREEVIGWRRRRARRRTEQP